MNEPQELSKAQEDALVDIATDVMTKLQADVMAVMKPAVQTICDVVQSKPEAVQIVARHVQLCAIGALAVALDRDIPSKPRCLEMLDEIEEVVKKYCKTKPGDSSQA